MSERWRAGRKVKRTLYIHEGDDVETGRLVGMVDTPELAQAICAAMNARTDLAEVGDLRESLGAALREAFDHWIVAEWICCEPLQKGHKLCKKGHAARRMVRALLVDDPESHPQRSPILDAVVAVVHRQASVVRVKPGVAVIAGEEVDVVAGECTTRQEGEEAL